MKKKVGKPSLSFSLPPKLVDLSKIEEELSSIQNGKIISGTDRAAQTVFRTCTLNIVSLVADQRGADLAADAVVAISDRHPSRSIIILYQPRAKTSKLTSHVSGHCRLTGSGQKHVCCEQINLKAAGHIGEHLPSALSSLLAADMPVYLWWSGQIPPEDELFDRLAEQTDVLVTKVEDAADPEAALLWLASYHEQKGDHPVLAEMAWFQLLEWRRFVISFFDKPVQNLPLDIVDNITIRCGTKVPSPEALLFGGWLSASLDWIPVSAERRKGGLTWKMDNKGRPAIVIFVPAHPASGKVEKIASVEMSAGKGKVQSLSLSSERRKSCLKGLWSVSEENSAVSKIVRPPGDSPLEEILCRILESTTGDPAFVMSLKQTAGAARRTGT